MNAERAEETSCSDDCSRSVNSETSSQEELEWDDYSPPLCSCTDECSCTLSSSQCISCRGLVSCHSCVGGPCPSPSCWLESRVPCPRDKPRASCFAWPRSRCVVVRRDEGGAESTGDDLLSIDTPTNSRASRLVSSTQEGVRDASIIPSGKPSSASIDFRRKCTAYWDGVRSLHSIPSSTEEYQTEEADTRTSLYSLLSVSDSETSHPSTLRIYHSFSAPSGRIRVNRIYLARTRRPHSADDIYRLRISSSSEDHDKFSEDDEPTCMYGHQTKGVCSAVQFSQTVTTHCYEGEFSFHSALPVRECNAIIHIGNQEEQEKQSSDMNSRADDSCSRSRHSKQHKHKNTKHQSDRDQQAEDLPARSREQCNRGKQPTNHKKDNPHSQDQVDCDQSHKDPSDHDKARQHNKVRQHPWNIDHQYLDTKLLPDHYSDPKDQHRHTHRIKEHDDHHDDSRADDNCHVNHKEDHSGDHHGHRHHIRSQKDSKRYCSKRHTDGIDTDPRRGLRDHPDRRQHNIDNNDCCRDSKEQHVDNRNHGQRSKGSSLRESRVQLGDFQKKLDKGACCYESEDSSSLKSKDQNIRTHRERSHADSSDKSRTDKGHPYEELNYDYAHITNHESDSCCVDNCCCKKCASKKKTSRTLELHGPKQRYKNVKDSDVSFIPQTDSDQDKDSSRHKHIDCDCIRVLDDDEVHLPDQQEHSDGDRECSRANSSDVHKDPSFKTYKVSKSYSRGFSSDTESNLEVFVKDLKCKQSSNLDNDRLYLSLVNYEKARQVEEEQKQCKSENRESEERVDKLDAKCGLNNACNITKIPNVSSSKACERTQTVCLADDRQICIDLKCCDYPETIPPLEYFHARAKVGIEGDLDDRPQNESPLCYEPKPAPLRCCTPEPLKQTCSVESVHQLQSQQCFEPLLAPPPQSQRTLCRVTPQGAPCIFMAQPSVYMPGKLPQCPVLAYKSTVDGDRRPTSIRGKAENMPIVRRFIPMQLGDITDIYQIEAVSNRLSWGLKPELVNDELARAVIKTTNSFVESERRAPVKSVGWAEQVAPPIHSDSASTACIDNDSFDSMTSCTTQHRNPCTTQKIPQDRYSCTVPRSNIQGSSHPLGCSSGPVGSPLRSILIGSRVSEESRMSSMIGGSKVPGGSGLSSSILGGCRLIPVANDGFLTSSDRSNSWGCPDISETIHDQEDARYFIIADFENKRHTFGYSDRIDRVRLTRQTTINPFGLAISSFCAKPEVLVASPLLDEADVCYVDPSFVGVEVIPAIEDLVVQIPSLTQPSQTQKPPETPTPCDPNNAPCDDSDATCLKELLAVPLSGRDDCDSETSADLDGHLCKASGRLSDSCLDTSAGAVPFCQPMRLSSKRTHLNLYPSDNCRCTSVTQVISRSMKHDGDSGNCAALRDKCSSSNRSKWYRSLSSKTIRDIPSEDSIRGGNSSASETRSEGQSNRTSTWVDCYTLPGSEQRRHSRACAGGGRLLDANEYGEEMQEASSCTDSVTTIYTRLPTSSARHRTRTVNCCSLATESCGETCFTRSTRCCKEFERKPPDSRKCRRSTPGQAILKCGHHCSPAAERIISSTVVASLGNHRCKTEDWNDGGRSREQTFERKYKALKRYCIETLGCVPPPPTPLCFQ